MMLSFPYISLQMAWYYFPLWLNKTPYIHHIFFIHSSIEGHLVIFYILGIMNNDAINMACSYFYYILT
jgi:hypothetical protein